MYFYLIITYYFIHLIMNVYIDKDSLLFGQCPHKIKNSSSDVIDVELDVNYEEHLINLTSVSEGIPFGHSLDCPTKLETPVVDPEGKIHIACCVIVERNNPKTQQKEVLITRRHERMRAFPNIWVFPGGHVDKDEHLEAAVLRELKEETGIEIQRESSELKCCAMWESVYPPEAKQGDIKKQHIIFFFSVLLSDDEISHMKLCQVEVSAAGWLNTEQIGFVLEQSSKSIPRREKDTEIEFITSIDHPKFCGIEIIDNLQKETTFDIKESLCGEDISIGKERLSTATKFVLSQWFLEQSKQVNKK